MRNIAKTAMHIRHTQQKGFTLVELLVAIAIIAALASLAVMGTRIAFKAGDATACANNMRQIGTVYQGLVTDGIETGGSHPPGTLPPYEGTLDDGAGTDFVWWELIAEKLEYAERESGRFDWIVHPKETELQNPLSSKRVGGSGEFTSFNASKDTRGGFAYNAKLGGDDPSGEANLDNSVATSNLVDEGNTIVFAESDDDSDTAGYVFSSIKDAPQGNYKDGAHCYFFSGSVQLIKNTQLTDPRKFEFYTNPTEKNHDTVE